MATKTFQEWWDEVEAAEQGDGAAPVVVEEMSGDISGDGSLLKEIVKSGEPGPMPKSGAKVRVLHFDSAHARTNLHKVIQLACTIFCHLPERAQTQTHTHVFSRR